LLAQLKLYNFTQDQLSDRLLGDIKNFIESEIHMGSQKQHIDMCHFKYCWCVHEKYANQDIGLGHLVKIYSYLKCQSHLICISHFNVSYEEEYLILISKQRDYTNHQLNTR
jgi:hypothetical protein